jgi:hypothetical protein
MSFSVCDLPSGEDIAEEDLLDGLRGNASALDGT